MRLTSFTDYTLRSLMYLGMHRDKLVTIQEIADLHDISKNHLTKVIHQLGASGLVETVRGRHGGMRLNREPEEINIGDVVRDTESDFHIAECFELDPGHCAFLRDCTLKRKLGEATEAFLHVLDGMTLADILPGPKGQGGAQPVIFQAPKKRT
ncbi:MAG: BadM/Rrf2 family transcriptional regulator [Pseudoduganella sp.]|jgi:Rrf2 family nitric oxide-sensitive transcriptional repressor|nr:BadM/Rrf2 family transcriptional regulator [Pseudoduganella sp.]